jgi:hypothetical protein
MAALVMAKSPSDESTHDGLEFGNRASGLSVANKGWTCHVPTDEDVRSARWSAWLVRACIYPYAWLLLDLVPVRAGTYSVHGTCFWASFQHGSEEESYWRHAQHVGEWNSWSWHAELYRQAD